ncbi:transporter [Streptomyces sp. NBC_00988]|uniref:transporter n=1 Tax=Streptomyces sp. NBC_00988 TaxID=2903704 RepID=UPI00386704CF|nr:transporter [Streptomyces sp. NBC_00988]
MNDLKLFRVASGQAAEIPGAAVALERHLQTLIEQNMEAMLGIRFLASEYGTGSWHRGRIDSLGLDESGNPVIVEYKRSNGKAVITQALSYLSWLRDHRHEFESLVKERLGDEAAGSVDWSNPRLVCIAGDFTSHDTNALEEIGRRIDLVSYRDFGGGLLALQLVASVTGSAAPSRTPSTPANRSAPSQGSEGGGSVVKSVRQFHDESPQSLRDLYADLDAMLISHADVQKEFQLHYVAYRRIKNVATIRFQPRSHILVVRLAVDPDTVELVEGFARDVRKIGCLGTGPLELRIRSHGDLARADYLVRRSVEGR